jgi:hypothetical protein
MEVPVSQVQHRAVNPTLQPCAALLLLGVTLAAPPGFSKTSPAHVRITIRVMDYVNLSTDTRDELAANTRRILRDAGVDAEFVECRLGQTDTGNSICHTSLGPADFILRIVDAHRTSNASELGYSAATQQGGAYITVFINPEKKRARVETLSDAALLGHTTAHELGHLLLGPDSHSDSGIMRPLWSRRDEEWIAKRALLFHPRQAERMRAAVSARVDAWTIAQFREQVHPPVEAVRQSRPR